MPKLWIRNFAKKKKKIPMRRPDIRRSRQKKDNNWWILKLNVKHDTRSTIEWVLSIKIIRSTFTNTNIHGDLRSILIQNGMEVDIKYDIHGHIDPHISCLCCFMFCYWFFSYFAQYTNWCIRIVQIPRMCIDKKMRFIRRYQLIERYSSLVDKHLCRTWLFGKKNFWHFFVLFQLAWVRNRTK